MATPYNHKAIEKKWRENWAANPVNVKEDENGKRQKYYCLDMFPYPSGNGLQYQLGTHHHQPVVKCLSIIC